MSVPVQSTSTVLRKRKRAPFVLHLESTPQPTDTSDSDCHEASPLAGPLAAPLILINGVLTKNTKKKYKCSYERCEKAYTKPSRLAEHERSHTGDRPFVCPTCEKSYLRDTHLQAHVRSHLPESARPLVCEEEGCGKRFWTSQHLRVHADWHRGARDFKCTDAGCAESFSKHYQLRAHICSAHSPAGTKAYICDHEGCDKSFATNQKLKTHLKVHDDKQYTCVQPTCLAGSSQSASGSYTPTYFPTWTALQSHIRSAHPPTCHYASCNEKKFTSQKGLTAHLKGVHSFEDEQGKENTDEEEEDAGEERRKKTRRGGEFGRDWLCEAEGCGKDFKSKKALTVHTRVTHLGRRDHVCPFDECEATFGYKHLLQRHLAKKHTSTRSPQSSSDEHAMEGDQGDETGMVSIDFLTGHMYDVQAKEKMATLNALRCPHPDLSSFAVTYTPAIVGSCEYVFTRGYDLRRHLLAEHGVEAGKDVVDKWVRREKARLGRGKVASA